MYRLTLQLYGAGKWQDAMTLTFDDPKAGFESSCSFGYEQGYLLENLEDIHNIFAKAVSAQVPLDWNAWTLKKAPAFLHDIAPAGAAKRFLMARIGREKPEELSTDLFLLSRSTPAPVGHMRIKESVEALDTRPLGFQREAIITRDSRFLEYAYEQGAAIGGATGAGGEAPKLLMAEDREGLLYPDAVLNDAQVTRHWFVKFSRNKAGKTDQDILRSEYHYYRALHTLGIETVQAEGLVLEEGSKPSLWMRRFDRRVTEQGVERLAVESIYSLAGVTTPGSYMNHLEVIQLLAQLWQRAGQGAQVQALVGEYLRRDLLNKILGNSDNHGRNTAIIRDASTLRLAPVYDLAPMIMDDEGVTRTTKWPKAIEVAGRIDWENACTALAGIADPQTAFDSLRQDAKELLALPDILADSGLPAVTMNHPGIALKNLPQRLKDWGLL